MSEWYTCRADGLGCEDVLSSDPERAAADFAEGIDTTDGVSFPIVVSVWLRGVAEDQTHWRVTRKVRAAYTATAVTHV